MFNSEMAGFLAHSVELEAESRQRYQEFAEAMAAHNNPAVAAFFEDMADEAGKHLAEVEALVGGRVLPQFNAWEFDWPDTEAPETGSYEALHYRMSLREAMALALHNEQAAEQFYRQFAESAGDRETKSLALEFAEEEASHCQALQRKIDALADDPANLRQEDDPPHTPE